MAFTIGCAAFDEDRTVEIDGENCDRLYINMDKTTNTTEVNPQ